MDINRINYEKFFLLYLDRELSPAEMTEVEKFLAEHTDLQREFNLLQQTVFVPETIQFEQKELLFRKEEKRRIIPLYRLRIAAAIAGLLLGSWYIISQVGREPEKIATDKKIAAAANDHKAVPPAVANEVSNTGQQTAVEKQEGVKTVEQVKTGLSQNNLRRGGNKDVPKSGIHQSQAAVQDIADNGTEETTLLVKKSNASVEIQPSSMNNTDPRSVNSHPAKPDPIVLTAAVESAGAQVNNNGVLNEPESQPENAISVVALNNPNKGISKFFKKFTSSTPETESSRKIRVSVFQISY
jgi:hypothetical protein